MRNVAKCFVRRWCIQKLFIELIMWKYYPTINIIFPQGKHSLTKKKTGNITKIYVNVLYKSLWFCCLLCIQMTNLTVYVRFYHISFNTSMIKIDDIYFSTTGYLPQLRNICQYRKNIQHSILYHTNFIYISIDNCKWELFPTFLFEDGVHITCLLNWIYVEVISNIKCDI